MALYCATCGYRKEFPDYFVPEVNRDEDVDDVIVVLDKGTMALLTKPTVSTYCEECGTREAETWSIAFGSDTLGGITYYRCTSCGHTWRYIE